MGDSGYGFTSILGGITSGILEGLKIREQKKIKKKELELQERAIGLKEKDIKMKDTRERQEFVKRFGKKGDPIPGTEYVDPETGEAEPGSEERMGYDAIEWEKLKSAERRAATMATGRDLSREGGMDIKEANLRMAALSSLTKSRAEIADLDSKVAEAETTVQMLQSRASKSGLSPDVATKLELNIKQAEKERDALRKASIEAEGSRNRYENEYRSRLKSGGDDDFEAYYFTNKNAISQETNISRLKQLIRTIENDTISVPRLKKYESALLKEALARIKEIKSKRKSMIESGDVSTTVVEERTDEFIEKGSRR